MATHRLRLGGAGSRGVRVTPYGEDALLVECADPVAVAAAARLQEGVVDAVPGDGCVVVRGATRLNVGALSAARRSAEPRTHVLTAVYDGPDLGDFPADVAALHAAATYTVAYLGFSPGFAYLDGLAPALALPRLDTPRPTVPAGSIGVAGGRCCVYPSASPGGWRLIGRVVDAVLFDVRQEPPALLAPGDLVRFVPC